MEKEIRDRFNKKLLRQVGRRYGLLPEQMEVIGGFESFIYEFSRQDGNFILRIGHSIRRNENLIRGEVDWINYLAAGGAGVAKAILSENGELVEAIDDGSDGQFLATAFVKAKGGAAWQMEKWDNILFERYGRLLGRIHHLSKQYQLPNPAWKRPEWDDPIMRIDNWLPAAQSVVQERMRTVLQILRALPKDRESYGLIHQDAHGGNFFVDEDYNITLFDFDDCAYGHYIYDIAMVLFYAVTNRSDAVDFGYEFMQHFLRGYRQNELEPVWMLEIPHFLKYREIDLYAVIHRSFDANNLEDSWVANFMQGRRAKIEKDVPYLEIDYGRLVQI